LEGSGSQTSTYPSLFHDNPFHFDPFYVFQNLNLAHHVEAGSLEFVDVLAEIQPTPDRRQNLRLLIERVQGCLDRAADGPALIIVDDISTLDWIGFPLLELSRFLRALRATCLKVRGIMSTNVGSLTTSQGKGDPHHPAPHCNS